MFDRPARDRLARMADIEQLARDARIQIETATTVAELDAAKTAHLGKNGPLVLLLRNIKDLPPEQRGHVGKNGNVARKQLEALVQQRHDQLAAAELDEQLRADVLDVTLPARSMPQGSLHLLTQTRRLLEDIFLGMGYDVVDAPEVENEWYGFTALNTPVGHPARNPSDTFYVAGRDQGAGANDDALILRTQTSTAQLRAMQLRKPPLYVVHPGRVYRRDDIDATHSDMFHQMEALAIDEGLTLANLKGTIESFLHRLFGEDLDVRLRTHFFPFTEPSVEADVQCFSCRGTGDPGAEDIQSGDFDRCRVCRGEGWIEIMGAGMVDPNVLDMVDGYRQPDADRTLSGFAFGIGIDRVAMLRHGFPDLRMLFHNDLRFVRQFAGRA
jgi:phenylalanyl-tRNA synthetase alpha chain